MEFSLFKKCKDCGKCLEDIETHFYRRSSTKDGFSTRCRNCYNRREYQLRKTRNFMENKQSTPNIDLFTHNLAVLKQVLEGLNSDLKNPHFIACKVVGSPSVNKEGFRIIDTTDGRLMTTRMLTGLSGIYLWSVSYHRLSELITGDSIELLPSYKMESKSEVA